MNLYQFSSDDDLVVRLEAKYCEQKMKTCKKHIRKFRRESKQERMVKVLFEFSGGIEDFLIWARS